MTTLTRAKITFERILIPTDFSDASLDAVEYAKSIATQANSQLLLVKVNPLSNPITPPEAAWIDQTAVLQQIQEQLEESGAALRSEGFRATAISATGALLDEIVSIVKKEKIDLIVLGTHGKKGLERLILGSDAEAVLRNVSCPVLTVGPGMLAVRDKVWPPKNIICATTLHPDSAWIAAYAYSLAQQFCAKFTLTHVEQMGGHHQDSDWRHFEDAFRQHLPADTKPSPFRWTSLLSDVSPGDELVDFAKRQDADLIVMGARIASVLTTHLRHGIAPRVFADAPCPVMTLHQPRRPGFVLSLLSEGATQLAHFSLFT